METYRLLAIAIFSLVMWVWAMRKLDPVPSPFKEWFFKKNIGKIGMGLLVCAIGFLAKDSFMDILGMVKADIYIIFLCGGGGVAISGYFGMKNAGEARAEIKENAVAK